MPFFDYSIPFKDDPCDDKEDKYYLSEDCEDNEFFGTEWLLQLGIGAGKPITVWNPHKDLNMECVDIDFLDACLAEKEM